MICKTCNGKGTVPCKSTKEAEKQMSWTKPCPQCSAAPPAPQAEGEIERAHTENLAELAKMIEHHRGDIGVWLSGEMVMCRYIMPEELPIILAALRSAQAPATPTEIEQLLKNAGLTSRDGTLLIEEWTTTQS